MLTEHPTDTGFLPLAFPALQDDARRQLEAQALARGHAAGYAAGMKAAARDVEVQRSRLEAEHQVLLSHVQARLERSTAILDAASAALNARTAPVVADARDTLAAAAMELTEALVGYELAGDANSARSALARALVGTEPVDVHRVRLNPADLAFLQSDGQVQTDVVLVPDDRLARGDALAEWQDGYLDARISTALARAKTILLGETWTRQSRAVVAVAS